MFLFGLFLFFGILFAISHGVYLHKLGNHIKKSHPGKWKEITPERFMGLSQNKLESRNYFKEVQFVFSTEYFNDESIKVLKKRQSCRYF